MHCWLAAHHGGVTAGTLQWLLSLLLSCLVGGGTYHRDVAVVAQCLVGTVLLSGWAPAVIKAQFNYTVIQGNIKLFSGFLLYSPMHVTMEIG